MNTPGLIILILLNIPLYFLYGRIFFKTWDDFGEAISYLFIPSIFTTLQGEFWNRWWAGTKMFGWFALCVGTVYLEYVKIGQITSWW
ncbi:hypothetical protein JW926_08690 [Candidatus Sumerlaeota bacterium]|nr:hypothetical protein [Candidatus Sumerlaeota bacterium]